MKIARSKNLTDKILNNGRFSRIQLSVFALVFVVAGYFIWHALALDLNHAVLDNGTCGTNLQLGSDPNASSSATPTFWLYGNGGLSSYNVFIDGTSIGTFNSNGYANVCIYTPTALSEGSHRLSGNEIKPNPSNTIFPYDFRVDTVPPAIPSKPSLHSATDSGVAGDNITSFRNLKFTGTADPGITVQVYRATVLAAGASADSNGNWLATTTTQNPGTYQYQALTIDTAGNKSDRSSALPVTIDTTAPNAGISNPSNGETVAANVPISGSASDSVGLWKVDIKVDGSLKKNYTGTPLTSNTFSYNWDSTSVSNGSHAVSITATDLAGTTTTQSVNVSVANGAGPIVPGAPTLNSATAGNGSVSIQWSVPSSNGGSAINSYKVYRGTSSGSVSLLNTGGCANLGNVLSCTDNNLSAGTTYYYQVSAVNSIGEGSKSNEKSASVVGIPGAPVLSSAVPGNSKVTLLWATPASNGGSAIIGYTATASPGSVSCTTTALSCDISGLTNGTSYSFTVKATNSAGTGPASNSLSATPATTPAAPTLNSATAGSNNIVINWSPPASNGGAAITGYKIYRGTSSGSGTLLANVGGTNTYTDTTASMAVTYFYKISALNTVGEGSQSNEKSATIPDSIAPTVNSLSCPASNCTNLSGAVTFSASASDNVGVTQVQFFIVDSLNNSTLIGTALTSPYSVNWNSASMPNGSYTLTAMAFDQAGNSTSASVAISTNNADTTRPTASLTAPTNNATVSNNVAVSASASDNIGVTKVEFLIDGVIKSQDFDSPYNYAWDSTKALNGSHSIRAIAYDAANNSSLLVIPPTANPNQITVNVVNADTAPPTPPTNVTASAPDHTRVNLSWDTSTDNVGVTGYHIIKNGVTQPLISATNFSDTNVAAGNTYTYQVMARDAAGNFSAVAPVTPISITVPSAPDTQPPSIPTLSANAPTSYQVNLSWSPSSDSQTGNSGISGYELFRNTNSGNPYTTVAGNVLSYGDTAVIPGIQYTYWVRAVDGAGNKSGLSNASTVITPAAPDTTAPSVPQNVSAFSATSAGVNISWSASTDTGGSGLAGYKIYRSLTLNGTYSPIAQPAGTGTAYADTNVTANTPYYYKVSARDNAGNESGLSTPAASVTVPDTINPDVRLTSPSDGDTLSGTITITADASDNAGVNRVEFYVDGTKYLGSDFSSPYAILWNSASELNGSHTLSAKAFDNAGNSNFSTITITVSAGSQDTQAPSVAITNPASNANVSGTVSVDVTATDNPGGSGVNYVKFIINGATVYTDYTAPYNYNWNTAGLSNGNYSIAVLARDNAGNAATFQIAVNVLNGDTQKPSAPTALNAVAPDHTKVNLSWIASSDNVGVAGYRLIKNGVTLPNAVTATSFTDTNVNPGVLYTYFVYAYDAAGNVSNLSNGASVTTPSTPDTSAPTIPSNLVAVNISSGQINLTWSASTDNVGVIGYDIYRNNTKIAATSSTSYGNTGLAPNTSYTYYVVARDAAGNSSLPSATASATTQPAQSSTGSISGTVTSQSNGQAVSGAVVTLTISRKNKITATTNSSGNYTFNGLAPNNYNISISASGYKSQTLSANVTAGNTTIANASLAICSGKNCNR